MILHLLSPDVSTYCGKRGSGRAVLNATTERELASCEKCLCKYDTWRRHRDATATPTSRMLEPGSSIGSLARA
jgi:hypothetical protein